MDINIINSIVQRLDRIESKIEDIEKFINIGKKKEKKNDYQTINHIQYDFNNDLYNIQTIEGSTLNISISLKEIKNIIDYLKSNEYYILNNYSIVTTIK